MKDFIVAAVTILLVSIFAIWIHIVINTPVRNIDKESCDVKIYNNEGNVIYEKDNLFEKWYEYDDKGNMIHVKQNSSEEWFASEEWYEYNDKGNVVHIKDSKNREWWFNYRYDDRGRVTRKENKYGAIYLYEYDDESNIVRENMDDDWEYIYEYDGRRNKIFKKERYITENNVLSPELYKYDSYGNIIKRIWDDGTSFSYEYFTADEKELKSTYDYDKKNPYHIRPLGTVLKCKVED